MLGEAKGSSVFGRDREILGELARRWTDEVELFDRTLEAAAGCRVSGHPGCICSPRRHPRRHHRADDAHDGKARPHEGQPTPAPHDLHRVIGFALNGRSRGP